MNPDLLALAKCRWQQAEIGQQLPFTSDYFGSVLAEYGATGFSKP